MSVFFFKFGNGCRREGTGSWEGDRKHKEVSLKVSVSSVQMKGKVKAGLHGTVPQNILNVASQRGDAARSVAFLLFDLSFPYKYMHQTYMLTTHAFDGT